MTTEHDSWGGLKKEQVSDLELSTGDQSIALEPYENSVAAVFNTVLASGPERLSNMRDRIKADRTENAKRFESFKDARRHRDQVEELVRRPGRARDLDRDRRLRRRRGRS